ncbi:hypothetical protein ACFPVT_02490 [Corynebacterium choanae]|nr:hypothetical protein [Corynebacterium choanae]
MAPKEHPHSTRRQLLRDSLVGFVSFFAMVASVQAVFNVLRPEPQVWPALLALVLVIATVVLYRATRPPRTQLPVETPTPAEDN